MFRSLPALALMLALSGCNGSGCRGSSSGEKVHAAAKGKGATRKGPRDDRLGAVRRWACQLAGLTMEGAAEALVASPYDLLVLDPTRSRKEHPDFDGKGLVGRLHATRGGAGRGRLVLARVSAGQAESSRDYWLEDWVAPSENGPGSPDFLVCKDPDGRPDSYPVAYWDPGWKKILLGVLDSVIADGYDGVYLDRVEVFLNTDVKQRAVSDGVDPAVEMIKLVGEIRRHARARVPRFLVVAQNGAGLVRGHPEYLGAIDAIAQEQIFFDGKTDADWDDPDACDVGVPGSGPYSRRFYIQRLEPYRAAGLPVLNVEYACDPANVREAYELSAKQGYLTYVSRRPLDRLAPPPGR